MHAMHLHACFFYYDGYLCENFAQPESKPHLIGGSGCHEPRYSRESRVKQWLVCMLMHGLRLQGFPGRGVVLVPVPQTMLIFLITVAAVAALFLLLVLSLACAVFLCCGHTYVSLLGLCCSSLISAVFCSSPCSAES